MAFTQGEVITLNGHTLVFIRNKVKKFVAVDINDPTHSYTCMGGESTGEFRQDVADKFLAYKLKAETERNVAVNESLKYKSLEIGRAVKISNGMEVFIVKHKRTKFIGVSADGELWDVKYIGIKSVLDYGITNETEEIQDLFSEILRTEG